MNALRFAMLAAPAAAAVVLAASPAGAETVKMIAVAGAPPNVSNVKALKEVFIPMVNKRLAASGKDYKIAWTEAYSSTLAKLNEVFEAVEENIGQVGVILKNFEESKLALDQIAYMVPFTDVTPEQAVAIDSDLRAKIPALNQQYAHHNQVFLLSAASAGSDMFTTFPLKGVDGLKGHKIGASGAMGQYLRGTGAVVVNSHMLDSYTSIRNGIYEGYPISVGLVVPFRTYQVTKYHLVVNFGSTPTTSLTVNADAWKKLPDFVQKIFRDSAVDWSEGINKIDEGRYAKFVGILKKAGIKKTVLSQAGRRKWAMMLPNIAEEWAAAREKDGLPGKLVLKTYMDDLRGRHIFVARNWDEK
jgi:TRAP-type transport system periplasmic protein